MRERERESLAENEKEMRKGVSYRVRAGQRIGVRESESPVRQWEIMGDNEKKYRGDRGRE